MHGDDLAPQDTHETGDATSAAAGDTSTAASSEPVGAPPQAEGGNDAAGLDLDAIQQDLADVEVALARLDAGTYWTDEVTGEPLPAELLAEHPTARRA